MRDAEGFQAYVSRQDYTITPLSLPGHSLGMLKGPLPLTSREHVYCTLLHSCPLILIALCSISLVLGFFLLRKSAPSAACQFKPLNQPEKSLSNDIITDVHILQSISELNLLTLPQSWIKQYSFR